MLYYTIIIVKLGAGLSVKSPMDYAYLEISLPLVDHPAMLTGGGWGAGKPYASDFNGLGEHSNFDYDAVG